MVLAHVGIEIAGLKNIPISNISVFLLQITEFCVHYAFMRINNPKSISEIARIRMAIMSYMDENKINQSQLSKASKVSQPIISRLISGVSLRTSKNINKLCVYANINARGRKHYEPSRDIDLFNALFAAIDSNPKKAHVVRKVLEAFADI